MVETLPSLLPLRDPVRLAVLRGSDLLDSPPEAAFDRLTKLAGKMLGCPISLVSLIDQDRQFFKSALGLREPVASERQTPLSHSFCQHVVLTGSPLIVTDARLDPLFRDHPAIEDLGVVAYLGIPITTSDGHTLGSFCVIDTEAREWSDETVETLQELADMVMTEIELRRVGLALRRTNLELREAEIAREELGQMLVHDLRNPLTSMLAAIECTSVSASITQGRMLQIAGESGKRLQRMIGDILDVSKAEAGRMQLQLEVASPSAIVRLAIEELLYTATMSGIRIETQFEEPLGMMKVDIEKLRRMFINLIANAIQHSKSGSRVLISVQPYPVDGLVFRISDQGTGIPKSAQTRIFEKYSAAGNKKKGVSSCGLGLAFSQKVVSAHGGEISLVSEEGEGATFQIILPRLPC